MAGDTADDALRRERIVSENLAARYAALLRENLELLVRLHELEHPDPPATEEATGE